MLRWHKILFPLTSCIEDDRIEDERRSLQLPSFFFLSKGNFFLPGSLTEASFSCL
ncbi:hypothetical protein CSUI_009259, partial [Cystoisospora suis]